MDMRGMRGLAALVTAAAVLPALSSGPAQGAPVRCQGEVATIVSAQEKVTGTPGDDVIVATGREVQVIGRAGDDTICVRGSRVAILTPGRGDDDVRVEAARLTLVQLQGAGDDSYTGGPGSDLVFTGAGRGERNRDHVHLGRGPDLLVLGGAGDSRGAVLAGGAGDDQLAVGARRGALTVDAEAERATYDGTTSARWDGFESHLVSATNATFVGTDEIDHVSITGGRVTADLRGGDDVLAVAPDVWVGDDLVAVVPDTAAPDTAAPDNLRSRPTIVPGGHGEDLPMAARRFLARAVAALPASARVDARSSARRATYAIDPGEGDDLLHVTSDAPRVVGDLATDLVSLRDESGAVLAEVPAPAFEGLQVDFTPYPEVETAAELIGDDAANMLRTNACHALVRGGAGDDHVRVGGDAGGSGFGMFTVLAGFSDGCRHTSEVHGEAGDDTLVSRLEAFDPRGVRPGRRIPVREVRVRDVLDGGDGTDSADAGLGTDTCLAEVVVSCER